MKDLRSDPGWMKDGFVLLIVLGLAASCFSGCIKSVDAWGLKMDFVGLDVHAGLNPIDKVHDQRGMNSFDSGGKY